MSPRHLSTHFGEPLSVDSKKLVNDVRERLTQPINANFGTDFNIYRFVLNAERALKNRKDIVESAAKALDQHLKVRRCMNLDELPEITFKENRLFKERFLPCGEIWDAVDASNRLLWFIEYATISVEGIAHGMRSSESIRWQFRQFEHMLRRVNRQEEATGRLSSLRHIIDMNGYEINPFTMLFVSSGTLSYYSQLFHYDNYPELVNPIELVNIAKWIHMPYRIIKTMMPAGFSDRFRLHDGNFLQYLTSEINADDIPTTLGGNNKEITCAPADRHEDKIWTPTDTEIIKALEAVHIPARKMRYFRVVVGNEDQVLSWYYRVDGDFYFGIFYEPLAKTSKEENNGAMPNSPAKKAHHHAHQEQLDMDAKETVSPWFKLSAKLVDENDSLICGSPGVYYVAFSNKQCWLHSRSIEAIVTLSSNDATTTSAPAKKYWRYHQDGTHEELSSQFQVLADLESTAMRWRSIADAK